MPSRIESRFLDDVAVIILTLVYIVLVPLLIILCTPIYLIRTILSFLLCNLNIFGYTALLPTRNSIFATDNIYQSPKGTIVLRLSFDGTINPENLQNLIRTRLINKKNRMNKLKYSELQQSVERFIGFYFYKWDREFRVSNHVKWIHNPKETFHTLDETSIHENLIRQPFQPARSPWEFVGMNLIEGESTVYFRIHHCLADGYSIAQIIMEELCGMKMDFHKRLTTNASVQLTRFSALDLWRIPNEQVKQRYFSKDTNVLHNSEINLSRRYHSFCTDPIPLDLVKGIMNKGNTSFTAVILACVTEGLRKHFLATRTHVPDYLHTICPLPIANHGDGLGNNWTFCFVPLPTGANDSLEMLKSINEWLDRVKKSSVSKVNWALIPLVGGLTSSLVKEFSRNTFSTVITSVFAGPQETLYLDGIPCKDLVFAGGLLHGNQGICITVVSYRDKLRIFIMIDHALMPEDSARKILEDIDQQMAALNTNH